MFYQISVEELNILWVLTVILLIGKFLLVFFLGYKIIERKKKTGEFSMGFVFGVFITILFLLISRIFYSFFDFVYTGFDSTKFHTFPAIVYWKLGAFISILGYSIFLLITDRKVLDLKLKGIPGIILLIIASIILLYPIANPGDFEFISIFFIFANLVAIVIPIIFFIMARKKTPFRIPAIALALGVIIYAIGSNITIEPLMNAVAQAVGTSVRIPIFTLSLIFKLLGLALFAFGVTEFAIKFSKE